MWWWWLVACGPSLEATGPEGMVGRIVDATGQPVVGQQVSTIETSDETDEDGRFALIWQPPDQHISIRRKGLVIRRTYDPSDDGQVVELRLPPMRQAALTCPPTPCDARLSWSLPNRYAAELRLRCKEPMATHTLYEVPSTPPSVSCSVGKGKAAEDVPLSVLDRGTSIRLVPPKQPVRVELRPVSDELPEGCEVQVGGAPAEGHGLGMWTAAATGPVTVRAWCGDRPARPATVDADAPDPFVTLEWSPTGPALDPVEGFEGELTLVAESGEASGWSLPLRPSDDGSYLLPPLSVGTYRVLMVAEGEDAALLAQPPAASPGTLVLAPTAGASFVGRLVLEQDLEGGTVPVKKGDR